MNKLKVIEALHRLKEDILEVNKLFLRRKEYKVFWSKIWNKGKINLKPIENEIKKLTQTLTEEKK